jgi:hypothetical protein
MEARHTIGHTKRTYWLNLPLRDPSGPELNVKSAHR